MIKDRNVAISVAVRARKNLSARWIAVRTEFVTRSFLRPIGTFRILCLVVPLVSVVKLSLQVCHLLAFFLVPGVGCELLILERQQCTPDFKELFADLFVLSYFVPRSEEADGRIEGHDCGTD